MRGPDVRRTRTTLSSGNRRAFAPRLGRGDRRTPPRPLPTARFWTPSKFRERLVELRSPRRRRHVGNCRRFSVGMFVAGRQRCRLRHRRLRLCRLLVLARAQRARRGRLAGTGALAPARRHRNAWNVNLCGLARRCRARPQLARDRDERERREVGKNHRNSADSGREIEPLRAEIEAFVHSIETNPPTKTDGRSAIAVTKALAMAEACSLQATAALV